MGSLADSLRLFRRTLWKRPLAVIIPVVTLALAIGATVSIFSIVNAILLQSLPYSEPDRLVMVWPENEKQGLDRQQMSGQEFADWRRDSDVFEHVVAFGPWLATVSGPGDAEMIHGYRISPGVFQMLGVEPHIGRGFLPEEENPGGEPVLVLRYSLWQRRFNGDPNVIGSKLLLQDRPHTIVGVMPPDFQFFNRQSEMFMPLAADFARFGRRGRGLRIMGRLKDGLSLEEAQARAAVFAGNLARDYPDTNAGWSVRLAPLPLDAAGDVRQALLVLMTAVGFVLLIACANVASLRLVQAASRSKELALRAAIGAGRWRLMKQWLAESFVLAIAGGALGLGLAWALVNYFQTLIPAPTSFGRYLIQMDGISIDPPVVGFAAGVTLLTALLAGLIPALRASKPDLAGALKDAGAGSAGGLHSRRSREALVVGEVAVAVLVVIGAGLVVRSFQKLYERGPGLRPENVITAVLRLPAWEFQEQMREQAESSEEQFQLYLAMIRAANDEMFRRLERLPGVVAVGATSNLPLTDWVHASDFMIEGRQDFAEGGRPQAIYRTVTPGYFQTMGIPLLAGRVFEVANTPENVPVAVINEEMAKRYWPDADPLGQRISFGNDPARARWSTIVSVVGSVRDAGIDQSARPTWYRSQSQDPLAYMTLTIKTASDPRAIMPAVRAEMKAVNPGIALYRIWKMEDVVLDSTWKYRYAMLLLSGLGVLSLVLAVIGVYGVMSQSVSERVQEIGVRISLGASRMDVLRLVTGQALRLVGVGVAVGFVAALALTRLLAGVLFGVEPADPPTFLSVGVTVLLASLVAAYLPARRAAAVDPISALRHE